MSPSPPVNVPRSIHQVLSQIRSKVFMTTYNPTSARIGTKYLKKKQVGHLALQYYPKPPHRPALLNADGKGAMYPGWTGRLPEIPVKPQVSSPEGEGNATAGPSSETTSSASESSTSESSSTPAESSPSPTETSNAPTASAPSKAQIQAALREAGIRPDSMFFGADNYIGPAPPLYYQHTQWQVDPKEVYRLNKLEKRRRIGKVTPKKGEGKRSQLGKRR